MDSTPSASKLNGDSHSPSGSAGGGAIWTPASAFVSHAASTGYGHPLVTVCWIVVCRRVLRAQSERGTRKNEGSGKLFLFVAINALTTFARAKSTPLRAQTRKHAPYYRRTVFFHTASRLGILRRIDRVRGTRPTPRHAGVGPAWVGRRHWPALRRRNGNTLPGGNTCADRPPRAPPVGSTQMKGREVKSCRKASSKFWFL